LPLASSHPEDILVITPSDHIIDEMQLYEAAIQEAIEKQQMDILLLLELYLQTGKDMDTLSAKAMM
jgi:mannose-1-phosphate guanylyltransferase